MPFELCRLQLKVMWREEQTTSFLEIWFSFSMSLGLYKQKNKEQKTGNDFTICKLTFYGMLSLILQYILHRKQTYAVQKTPELNLSWPVDPDHNKIFYGDITSSQKQLGSPA